MRGGIKLEDSKIIDLYWARKEQALAETDAKYGSYCRTIARNILRNFEDTEECVSDTWLHAWNSMPPQRPGILSAFLGRITRNLSFDRCKYQQAAKRGGGALPLALDELGECIPSAQRVEYALEQKELAAVIDRFLRHPGISLMQSPENGQKYRFLRRLPRGLRLL